MGTVYFSDWEFDVISPDGRHVLLMQSHYGPYHIDGVPGAAGHGGLSQSAPCHPETQFPDHAGSCLAKTSSDRDVKNDLSVSWPLVACTRTTLTGSIVVHPTVGVVFTARFAHEKKT